MTSHKVPWYILKSQIEEKREQDKKKKDLASMGMKNEIKGPIKSNNNVKKNIKSKPNIPPGRKKSQKKKKLLPQTKIKKSSIIPKQNKSNIVLSKLPTDAAIRPPLASNTLLLEPQTSQSQQIIEEKLKENNRQQIVNKCPINPFKRKQVKKQTNNKTTTVDVYYRNPPLLPCITMLPKVEKINVGRRLRRIILEEMYIPIRDRSREKKRDCIQRCVKKNFIYNNMFNKLLILHNYENNGQSLINKANHNFINYQHYYIRQALTERARCEHLYTTLFNLFKIRYILNKRFHNNLILVDTNEEKVNKLTFSQYKSRLLIPLWRILSEPIKIMVGIETGDFKKCIESVIEKVETFNRTVKDFKDTIALLEKIKPKEQNQDKQINENYLNNQHLIKEQLDIINTQMQIIKNHQNKTD
uniref:Wsv161-like protein n=1 Tax=Trachysalambria curvirostris majanivirus TaxID=2984281 RepID=A0A9C7BQX9_9VIRU|nr:MAG: wsv161-like protein [Trachysalambria curvirostris majanivirus]